jgi:iron-sulfur cluster repair protein YtfE (RIC family)
MLIVRVRKKPPDPIALLLADHRRLRELFSRFTRTRRKPHSPAKIQQIVELACEELEMHATLEEQLFYPGVRARARAGFIEEAEVEHAAVRGIIADLRALEPSDPKYAAAFRVLMHYVRHHMEEEERQLFPRIRRARLDLVDLGHRMLTLKKSLLGEQDADRAPPASQADAEAVQRQDDDETRYRDLARH